MRLVEVPGNPVPSGAVLDRVVTSDGVALRVVRFPAKVREPKGTVLICQGRAEYIEKYFETVDDLRARGFAVATFDWRGQGLSARLLRNRRLGHVDDFSDYERDLEAVMREVVLPDCPRPFYAIAHSMGAAVVVPAASRRATWFERIVAAAPLAGLPGIPGRPPVRMLAELCVVVGLAACGLPGATVQIKRNSNFEGNFLTSDRQRFERNRAVLAAAPELEIGAPTIGWVQAAMRRTVAMSHPDFGADIPTPTTLVYAREDRVVCNKAIVDLAARLRNGKAIPIDRARHELLMESDAIRDGFLAVCDAVMPGTPAFVGEEIPEPV